MLREVFRGKHGSNFTKQLPRSKQRDACSNTALLLGPKTHPILIRLLENARPRMQTDGTPPQNSQPNAAPAATQGTNVQRAAEITERLRQTVGLAMVGQTAVIEQVIVTLIASGHALIEGVPGLGKTLLVRALAQAMSLNHARVQFTPDLMPSDITGHAVLDPATHEL